MADYEGAQVFAHPPIIQSVTSELDSRVIVSLHGSSQVTESSIQALSQSSNVNTPGATQFTVQVPSTNTILDRKILLSARVVVSATAAANATVDANVAPVPVSYPLNIKRNREYSSFS